MSKASAVIPAKAGIQENELPEGWVISRLSDCAEILDSKRIPINSKERSVRIDGKSQDELYPYYGATGQVGVIDDYIFEGEYLLIGEDGAPFFDKAKNVAYIAKGKFWVNNHAHILDALEGVTSNKYLLHYLNKFNYKDYVGGTTRLKLNQADLKQIPVPLAPPEQQKRIVAKIEELFSHIDAGIEALKKAKQLLKQYRQSVLKAAVTGELTKEWREANKDKLEPASQLLERILKERRQKCEEQQLEQFKAKGKIPKDDKWKEKYKEPDLSADSENAVDGWLTCRIDVIVDALGGYAFKSKEFTEIGHQIVKMANIKMDILDLDNRPSFIDKVPEEIVGKYRIVNGDILVTLTGTRKKRDYGYVVRIENNNKSLLLNQRIARLRTYLSEFSRYISLYLQSEEFRSEFFSYETGNVGQGNVGMKAVTEVLINLPPTEEQAEIIRKHDNMLDAMLRLEKDIDSQLYKVDRNKQSILASAYSGQL